jgi:hypothetical protein
MRTHRWLKALACGLCLGAAADTALAQAPWESQGNWVTADGSPAAAPIAGYPYAAAPPGAYQAPYATNNPSALYPAQPPAGFSPWPQISPYGMGNYASDTHYNQGGNWFRQVINKKREYNFSVDALSVIMAKPGPGTVGARPMSLDRITRGLDGFEVSTYGVAAQPGSGQNNNNTNGSGTIGPSTLLIDTGVYPYPFLFETGDVTPISVIDNALFPIHNFGMFGDFRTPGLQVNWGFENESGGGFKADAWWAFEDDQRFQRGHDKINGVTLTQPIIINQNGLMLFTKNGAVTWDTGIPISVLPVGNTPGINGGVVGAQKYDVMYRLTTSAEAGGGNLQFLMQDLMYSNSVVRVRPVWTGKYMYIGESFAFRGVDSGLSYTIDGEDGAGGGGGGGGGQQQAPTFRPVGPPFTINNDLFETQLNSNTWTHLAGPTVGFRYDFGRSDEFKIWGQTSAGLLANHETIRVNGFNAGETVVTEFLTGTNMLDADSRFSDTERNSHVSPVFEQTFMAESRVLSALPVIKEVPLLANANLKLGWTSTVIGKVARPTDSVAWLGFPRFPKVDVNYKNWYVSKFNVGLEWTY